MINYKFEEQEFQDSKDLVGSFFEKEVQNG
jgi:hypothetical protein